MDQNEILSSYPWMNKNLFERIIKIDYPESIAKVTDFSVKSALPPGENYGSIMIRATVNYKINSEIDVKKGFIIKAGFLKDKLKSISSELDLFGKEIRMFRDILPKIKQLLQNIGDDTEFSAKCYESSKSKQYLVLEDLTTRGYKNIDKRIGLNVEQFKQSITKIAKFHACTAVLLTQNYNFDDLQTSILSTDIMHQFISNCLLATVEYAKMKPDLSYLSDKIRSFADNIKPKIKEAITLTDSDFIALCHGDLWMNNCMYKCNESGSAIDAILLDYQNPYVGPAVLDVANHIYASFHEDLRDREFDLLIEHYHSVLADTLKKLNYSKSIPTLTGIHEQLLKKGFCYASICMSGTGLRMYENAGEDLGDLVGENDSGVRTILRMMLTPKAQNANEFSLNFVNRKGYLD